MAIRIIDPLVYSDGIVRTQLDVVLHNTGRGASTRTAIDIEMYPSLDKVRDNAIASCHKAEMAPALASSVFPGDSKGLKYGTQIPKDRMEHYLTEFNSPFDKAVFLPTIVGCVAYIAVNDPMIHHTPTALEIRTSDAKAVIGRELPLGEDALRLWDFEWTGPPPD